MLTKALRLTGELFVLAAIVIGLWLFYENNVTNLQSQQATAGAAAKLSQEWAGSQTVVPIQGRPFALLYIPRLKAAVWGLPVLEGVTQKDLAAGVGHYPLSDLPGQYGNFAVAGHRVTHGQPFYDFPKLQAGDSVFVRTQDAWYQYKLFATKFVSPADYQVVTRTPGVAWPNHLKPENLITLTTCDPAWNSYRRWIWWGTLIGTYSLAESPIVGLTP